MTKTLTIFLLTAAAAFSQAVTLTRTTLSSAISSSGQTAITVASATGISGPANNNGPFGGTQGTAGSGIYVDGEFMTVQSVSGTTLSVWRGQNGTRAATHASGVTVWIGSQDLFYADSEIPSGTCVLSKLKVYPRINIQLGEIFGCGSDGNWGYVGPGMADGATAWQKTAVTASYTVLPSDFLIAVGTLSAAITLTLPAASSLPGKVFILQDEAGGAGTNNITVTTAGGCASITTNFGVCRIRSNGTAWRVW